MDIRFNSSNLPVASNSDSAETSNTELKEHTNPSRPLTIRVGRSKREMKEITLNFPILSKRAKHTAFNPVETGRHKEKMKKSATSIPPFTYFCKVNNPIRTVQWSTHFQDIYQSLKQEKHLEIEALLNALSDVEIKSLPIATLPRHLLKKYESPISLSKLASFSNKTGNIFFRVLFDRLSSDELRVALLEPVDDYGKETLLHLACCVMDESSFKQLEQKLGMQTLLEMITRPVNDLNSPLAFACLYNKSTCLFDSVINQDRELIEKLLKGSPDTDQSLVQFMCNDLACRFYRYSNDEYNHRIKYLLDALSKQDRFDAVRFTGKSNESALLWACTEIYVFDLATILTESLDDDQKAELCTAPMGTGNSLVQKCLELNRTYKVVKLCMSIRNPSLRFKVLSICTSEGHSLFQQWLPYSDDIEVQKVNIEYLLRGMDDKHRELLIAGDRRIWDQTIGGTDHKYKTMCFSDFLQAQCGLKSRKYMTSLGHLLALRQQERIPIVVAFNRKNMCLARYLWKQIADPELQLKLLLYKTKNQTTLLRHMLDDESQWLHFKTRLKNTHCQIVHDSFAAELYKHAVATRRFDDAEYYFSQISDSKLKHDVTDDNQKYFLMNISKKTETDIESFFRGQTPSQCTESVIYILEHSLYDQKPLTKNLLQLITVQEKAGNKDAFVKWATSPQQGKQCPLITTLSRLAIAYREMNDPRNFLPLFSACREYLERGVSLNKQIFQGMISMMSEEQIKEFFLSLQDKSYNALHLLGYKDILETIVDTLGDSGRAFLEQINPATGGNLLHILFNSSLIDHKDIKLNDLINTVDWLDKTYGLTPFLQGRLENDGSTPLHVLLATVKKATRLNSSILQMVQAHILKQLCQPNADGILLSELLKLKDNNGCTPLHKFFSCMESNETIGDLLFQELGLETCFKLMHIKDKQGNTVMSHCLKLHDCFYTKYNNMFQTLPDTVKVQKLGSEASERV